ncbi:MAG: DNA polymerase III subunit delta' [Desulfovibrionaceae bacterium]|nr:DNA polymerase III subunit delta' [Desulfovibrionaceae bacterium]
MSDNLFLKSLYPDIATESLDPIRHILYNLRQTPPQVLLFDGGTEIERRTLAKYWAALNLCPNLTADGPCHKCPTCLQIAEDAHLDILAYDGYISKKDDDDSPGFYRAFNAENARSLKLVLRDAPHGRYRIVFFTGIVASRAEAPNALLKVLEEPSPYTLFVLLVPQRAQILPTLVSRSMCLTLPWPCQPNNESQAVAKLTASFAAFLNDKEDFLTKIASKSSLTLPLAQDFLVAFQKTVIRILANEKETPLDLELANLTPFKLMQLIGWIREAQEMLAATVTPLRVISALSMRCYTLFRS